MKTKTALFSIALCLAVIDLSNAEQSETHEHHKQIRHRPKRQYLTDYGYQHNPAWYRPRYPEDRRDDRSQDLLPHIYRLLEEISDLVRRPPPPPPPPQPIYIPYPVQYPCPQRCKCPTMNGTPNVTSRFPEMEDTNQNWGYDDSDEPEDDFSYQRPINFDPIPPAVSTTRPPLAVDHGTNQASVHQSRENPSATRRPKRCDAIILSCCDQSQTKQQQRACFVSANCVAAFDKRDVCSKQSVQEVIDSFASAYAPK